MGDIPGNTWNCRDAQRAKREKKQIAAPEEVKNITRNRQKRNIWL